MNQKEFFGFGSISHLVEILRLEKSQKVFLVTGKASYESCGAKKAIESRLSVPFFRFSDFSPNPKFEEIQKGYEEFRQGDYDFIMGVGGGSAIDVAKAIKMFNYDESGKKVPLVAIPTTAGSGSEATHFIVYYRGKEKQSQGSLNLTLPDYAIIDPEFILKLPSKISAETGLDALSQAVESFWSVNSTEESRVYASQAIRLLNENLKVSVNNPNMQSKQAVMRAANLAGKAINLSKTTACHAVAYPITSYFGVAHGHAAALTLGEMFIFNSFVTNEDCSDSRGADYVKDIIKELAKLFGFLTAEETNKYLSSLMIDLGLETRLSNLGINREGIETIIKNGFTPERVKNNPRVLREEDLRAMLTRIY
ncbi:MAG: phosphonoacetaldehyde reductase [Candidatus Nanoarchaeia archaeon]|nr:phosphonoacetaldehyde reductase [Candidatus Nanoarchaeia archaeon]